MDKELLFRFFAGETTLEEEKRIRRWLEAAPEHRSELLRERKIFDAILLRGDSSILQKTSRTMSFRKVAISLSGVAAVALLTIVLTSHFFIQSFKEGTLNTISVPPGQCVSITLADGTAVWLNANTKMEYPQSFRYADKRVVKIDGEAYFEVQKSERVPFIVETSQGHVEVMGTEFNVSAYGGTDEFETSLVKGKVKVCTSRQEIMLSPKEMAVLQDGQLVRQPMDYIDRLRWKEGIYCFKDEPFDDVLHQLELYYHVRFVKECSLAPTVKLNGKFRLVDGVEYALRVLQKKVDFSFRRDENKNVIYLK